MGADEAGPYLADMGRARQTWEAVGGPVVSGAIGGLVATTTWWAYLAVLIITVIGGLGAGAQHRTARGAALRGAVAGALWALALIAAVTLSGQEAVQLIPRPLGSLVAYAVVVTVAVTVVMWSVARRRARGPVAPQAND